jgi:hypothetical protein
MRNDGELPNEVVTTAANHSGVRKSNRSAPHRRLRSSALAAVLRALAEQPSLQSENVVEHAIDPPSLESMVGDHARPLQMVAKRCTQWAIDPRPPGYLGLFEQLQASIQRQLAEPMLPDRHVPSTSTLPASVTLTLTRSSDGSE